MILQVEFGIYLCFPRKKNLVVCARLSKGSTVPQKIKPQFESDSEFGPSRNNLHTGAPAGTFPEGAGETSPCYSFFPFHSWSVISRDGLIQKTLLATLTLTPAGSPHSTGLILFASGNINSFVKCSKVFYRIFYNLIEASPSSPIDNDIWSHNLMFYKSRGGGRTVGHTWMLILCFSRWQ